MNKQMHKPTKNGGCLTILLRQTGPGSKNICWKRSAIEPMVLPFGPSRGPPFCWPPHACKLASICDALGAMLSLAH
uniref:Uncharacterized protein n=1 Tax=Romanomermis culicivorax TaxID=13658 RepID=A0A915IEI2_ROMCU